MNHTASQIPVHSSEQKNWAKYTKAPCIVVFLLVVIGCGDYQMIDKSENVVISEKEYEDLKAKAALASQVGRYQLSREGLRTWRLDTATGESCLLLATDYDWKHDAKFQRPCSQLSQQ